MSAVVKLRVSGNLHWALQYAEIGMHVLALVPGDKRPAIPQWEQDASTDLSTVRGWWRRSPNAGIGVHCGKSGLIVVDVDPRNGGVETLVQLERDIGTPLWLLDPLEARTGGGGRHFVFRARGDQGHLPSKLGPGLDLLHGNRYIVVAPTVHPSGVPYEWEPTSVPFSNGAWARMAEFPDELASIARSGGRAAASANAADHRPLSALKVAPPPGEAQDGYREVSGELLAQPNPLEAEDPTKIALVRDALKRISPDCSRDDYVSVLAALHSTGWADGHDIAEEWAAGSLEDKYNERDFRRDWNSLRIDRDGRLVTLGTLFELAKRGGWVDPRTKPGTAQADTFGDISNGRRFAERFRDQFLYIAASKRWMAWNGQRWLSCSGEDMRAARTIIEEALDDAHAAYKNDPTERTRSNHAQALAAHRNVRKQEALLTVAATEEGMSVPSDAAFDGDPWLLNVRNGAVDLRTGMLLPSDPRRLMSRQCGASFDRSAMCPRWLAFLDAVFSGDAEVVRFIQRAVGYSLTGSVAEEVLFFLYGIGANGKSVFANVLNAVFGDYAVTVRAVMLARDLKGSGSDAEREKAQLPTAEAIQAAIERKVAEDAVAQFRIVERNGSPNDKCVYAGFVAAAFLQAKDEEMYKAWRTSEQQWCQAAESIARIEAMNP